ncbi:MAG: site-specific integrase [Deltaproteobacteria bacterium]|nr:site-specific integrase [Deltaproteobacteria bacterium]
MPRQKRVATDYPGVFYVEAQRIGGRGTERVYYIRFKHDGKLVEEPAGRQYRDGMTPAKAAKARGDKLENRKPTRREERTQKQAAEAAEAARPTLAKLWEEYKADHPNLKGLVTDENRFKKHIGPPLEDEKRKAPGYKPTLADKTPEDLLPIDLDRLRLSLAKDHKPATVRNVLELVRRIVNFGTRKKRTAGLSFKIGSRKSGATVEMPKVHNERTEDLAPEQLAALLTAIDADDNFQAANLMKLALFTGMRRGELFKLQWDAIDQQRGFILIRDPKGGKPQNIPLSADAKAILDAHPRDPKSPYVFPGRKGGQRVDINKAVREITKAAGLPADFRPLHGLRHTFASMLASSGKVDLYTLQKLLTHKSPTMTQRYAHLRDDALKDASGLAGSLVKASVEKAKKAAKGKLKAMK